MPTLKPVVLTIHRSHTVRNLLSYKHTALHLKVRYWILPTLIKPEYTEFQAVRNSSADYISFITIFFEKKKKHIRTHTHTHTHAPITPKNSSEEEGTTVTYVCHLFLSYSKRWSLVIVTVMCENAIEILAKSKEKRLLK